MNDLELREHFEEWAEPLRAAAPPGMAVLRRRIRRRRAKMAAAAGSALAVTGIVAGLLASGTINGTAGLKPSPATGTHSPAPGVSYSLRIIASPFETVQYPVPVAAPYVLLNGRGGDAANVMNAGEGSLAFGVSPSTTQGQGRGSFTAMAAAPNDRLFVVAQGGLGGTTFNELRVSATGGQGGPIMNGVTLPAGDGIYGMSVNPAGTRLAMNVEGRDGIGPLHLMIYKIATGALLGNFTEAGGTVNLQYWPAGDKLAFSYQASTGTTGDGLRILDSTRAATPGSSLLADSTVDPAVHGYARGTFSSDGSTVMNVAQAGSQMVLTEWAAASGRTLHKVTIGTAAANNTSANYCGILWASANGAALLTQCGTRQLEVVDGTPTAAKLAFTFPAPQVGGTDTFAW